MRLLAVGLVAAVLASASVVWAQQEAGDMELSVNVYYLATVGSDFDFSTGSIQGKLGAFVTDALEIGVAPTVSITTISTTFGGSDTETTVGSGFFGTFSFLSANAKMVPYVGAQYYIQDFDNAGDTSSLGVYGGAKYYFTEKAFLDAGGNYLISLAEEAEGGYLLFTAGFGFLFSR